MGDILRLSAGETFILTCCEASTGASGVDFTGVQRKGDINQRHFFSIFSILQFDGSCQI
jgi:hypothetical protein